MILVVFILIVACPLNAFSGDNRMNHENLYTLIDELALKEKLKIDDIETAFGTKLRKKEYIDPFLGSNVEFSIYEPENQKVLSFFSSIRVKIYSDNIPEWGIISFELADNECLSWKDIKYTSGEKATTMPDAGGRLTSLMYKVGKNTISFRKQGESECLFDVVINLDS